MPAASGQRCTSGFLNNLNRNIHLTPLLARQGRQLNEQWIFPSLQFTCPGSITRWTFRGVKGENFETSCSVEFTTWRRLDTFRNNIEYQQISTTRENIDKIALTLNESLFTYELTDPVQVQPGDIFGIEKGVFCASPENFDNILSQNISGSNSTTLSYRRSSGGRQFSLDSFSGVIEDDLIPLVMPVFGQFEVPYSGKFSRMQAFTKMPPEETVVVFTFAPSYYGNHTHIAIGGQAT